MLKVSFLWNASSVNHRSRNHYTQVLGRMGGRRKPKKLLTVPEPRSNCEEKSSTTRRKARCADGCKHWNSFCIAGSDTPIDLVTTWINTGLVGLYFILCFVGRLWWNNWYLCKTHPQMLYLLNTRNTFFIKFPPMFRNWATITLNNRLFWLAYLRDYNLSGRKCVCQEEKEIRDALPFKEEDEKQATEETEHLPQRDEDVREIPSISQPLHKLAHAPDVFCNNTHVRQCGLWLTDRWNRSALFYRDETFGYKFRLLSSRLWYRVLQTVTIVTKDPGTYKLSWRCEQQDLSKCW